MEVNIRKIDIINGDSNDIFNIINQIKNNENMKNIRNINDNNSIHVTYITEVKKHIFVVGKNYIQHEYSDDINLIKNIPQKSENTNLIRFKFW